MNSTTFIANLMTHYESSGVAVSNLNRAERIAVYRAREEAMGCERSGLVADWLEAEPRGSADMDYKIYSCEQQKGAHFTYGYTIPAEGKVWLQGFVRPRCSFCLGLLVKDERYLNASGVGIWDCPHCFPFGSLQAEFMLYH